MAYSESVAKGCERRLSRDVHVSPGSALTTKCNIHPGTLVAHWRWRHLSLLRAKESLLAVALMTFDIEKLPPVSAAHKQDQAHKVRAPIQS